MRIVSMAALEWLDPPFAAGHWTPQLIDPAGGRDVLGSAGEASAGVTWDLVMAGRPDVVIVMPCGLDADSARREAEMHRGRLLSLGATRRLAVDAGVFFPRPGPRLTDGLELLNHILHPDLISAPMDPAARAIGLVWGEGDA